MDDDCLANLSGLTHLRTLRLSGDGFDGSGFASLATCESLEYVSVGSPLFTVAMVEGLAALPKLKGLDLSRRAVDPAIAGALPKLASLESIELEDARMELTEEFLGAVGQLPTLKRLTLNQSLLTDEQLAQLLDAGCPTLEVLDLSNTEITDVGLSRLISNPPPQLRSIWLYSTGITADTASRLGTIPTLREVHVDYALKNVIQEQVERDNPNITSWGS
jgi:hypothetical protein